MAVAGCVEACQWKEPNLIGIFMDSNKRMHCNNHHLRMSFACFRVTMGPGTQLTCAICGKMLCAAAHDFYFVSYPTMGLRVSKMLWLPTVVDRIRDE